MRQFSQEELVEKIRSERCHIGELYDEINTLKRENANLKDYVKSLKDECISCPENKKNVKQAQTDTINTIIKYCENPNHWRELKDCKLFGGKSDDLQNFLNGIFKEVDV